MFIGFDAGQYAPDVLDILNTHPNRHVREVAAQTLAFLASPDDIPKLKSIMEKEESEFVRDEIAEAIRAISLEPRPPEN